MMPRKKRDYKAEEARRNALARERGFTSRSAQRRAIETGKAPAVRPDLIRTERTLRAQYDRATYLTDMRSDMGGFFRVPSEQRAKDWSSLFGRSNAARYLPDGPDNSAREESKRGYKTSAARFEPKSARELGVSREHYTNAYLAAFVVGDKRYERSRRRGSSALRYWLVDLNGYMTVDEYEQRYGNKPPIRDIGDGADSDYDE